MITGLAPKQKLANAMAKPTVAQTTGFQASTNIPEDGPSQPQPIPTPGGSLPPPKAPAPLTTPPRGPVAAQQPIGVSRTSDPVTSQNVNIAGNRNIMANAQSVDASQFGGGANVGTANVHANAGTGELIANNVSSNLPQHQMRAAQASAGGNFRDFEDRAYAQATDRYLNPQWDRSKKDFDQQMINRGIDIGTEAYDDAFDAFSRSKNDAYSKAAFDAMGYGRDTQNMAFNQSLQNANLRQDASRNNLAAAMSRDNLSAQIEQNNANRNLQAQGMNASNDLQAQNLNYMAGRDNANRSLGAQQFNANNQLSRDNLMAQLMSGNASRDLQAQGMNQSNALNWSQLDSSNAQANASRALQAAGMNQSNQLQRDSLVSGLMQRNADRKMQGDVFNANHDLNELNTMANIDFGYNDREYRDAVFNTQRNDVAYNRLSSILAGLQQGATPQVDTQGAYNSANSSAMNAYNAQMQNAANNQSSFNNLLGTGATAAAMFFSDRRLKHDIEQIGTDDNGLNVYTFKYHWSDEVETGYMADEVEKLYPEAVLNMPNGYKVVDYGAIA